MGREIERKFLVHDETWRKDSIGIHYRQGYIPADGCTVRVRIAGEKAFLTLKVRETFIARTEFEYAIPREEAEEMLARVCTAGMVEKMRYVVRHGDLCWEIDVFEGANAGLIVAEVELMHEEQAIELPEWVGAEVTHDPRYLNSHLAVHPFRAWDDDRA